MDVRKGQGMASRRELIWVQPAKAVVVYGLMIVFLAALVLGGVAYVDLLQRTRAVCEPLRAGQALGAQATTQVGKSFARTFGDSADKLGCSK